MLGRTVSVKIRFGDFATLTRSRTLQDPTDVGRVIVRDREGSLLLDSVGSRPPPRVGRRPRRAAAGRVLEVGACGMTQTGGAEVEDVMDAASERFGRGAVMPATLPRHGRAEPTEETGPFWRLNGAVTGARYRSTQSERPPVLPARPVGTSAAEAPLAVVPQACAVRRTSELRAGRRRRSSVPPRPSSRLPRRGDPGCRQDDVRPRVWRRELIAPAHRRPHRRGRAHRAPEDASGRMLRRAASGSGSNPGFSERPRWGPRGRFHGVAVTYAQVAVKACRPPAADRWPRAPS